MFLTNYFTQNSKQFSTFVLSVLIHFAGLLIAFGMAFPAPQLPIVAIVVLMAFPLVSAILITVMVYNNTITKSDTLQCSLFNALLIIIATSAVVVTHGKPLP